MSSTIRLSESDRPVATVQRPMSPVRWWAALGAIALAFQTVILIRWISGPYFARVDPGPTPLPSWMKVALVALQIALPIAATVVLYWFVVRPWRRTGRVGLDGLMAISFLFLSFHDPLSAYLNHWYTYNAWQVNMGSWLNSVPGALAPGTPTHQVAYPLLIVPPAYVVIFMLVTSMGTAVMRRAKAHWPGMPRLGLVAICFAIMVPFDIVFEGIVFMPLGSWEYPGGHIKIFADTYHGYPLNEALTTGVIFTMFACIRYFVDDRGQSLAERGAERLGTGVRVTAIRLLAVSGLITLAMTLGYSLPNMWFGAHSTAWNEDVQRRSYLTYTCGEGPALACPAPDVPLLRNDNRDGGANGREFGQLFPPVYPYDRG
ncbi:spirocyclase AveC family protein [Mycobacterium sp. CVI_P3]|uniref:Spirocyclase AveC family protein n=1 Tax=Mycobacterium pinniadriaticum TaxID=2994102 RepID=A0ABT3SBQ4_9MYCO|nr:spirocyclase AveC family protein [Mycobacterium pinniadriaticum]MCX2930044.1 spirocyclase AveC family protein [Mycobacterium pinniadriaticum]MCX2936307.1 spirocyclase AveC family protein [Mycobacterium pinniadriaticum]